MGGIGHGPPRWLDSSRAELSYSPDPTIDHAGLGMAGSGKVGDSCRLDPDEAEDLPSKLPEERILVDDAQEPSRRVGRE